MCRSDPHTPTACTSNSTSSGPMSGSGTFPGRNGKVSNYDQVQERVLAGTLPDGAAFDATRMTAWRHKGGANVCFFDGHVQWLAKTDIYKVGPGNTIIGNDGLWKVLD